MEQVKEYVAKLLECVVEYNHSLHSDTKVLKSIIYLYVLRAT